MPRGGGRRCRRPGVATGDRETEGPRDRETETERQRGSWWRNARSWWQQCPLQLVAVPVAIELVAECPWLVAAMPVAGGRARSNSRT